MPAQSSGAVAAMSILGESVWTKCSGVTMFVRVAAVGARAVAEFGVVGVARAAVRAVDLEVGLAVLAVHAALDDDADGRAVADLEALDVAADGGDVADDLVAGHHRVELAAPLAAHLVDVRVADAAVVDGEDDVVGVGLAAVK